MVNIARGRVVSTAAPVLAVALVCAVYAGGLDNGFVFDDAAYLSHPAVRDLDVADLVLSSWRDLDLYRPLALLSMAVDFAVWRQQAFGYHLTSLALHAAAAAALWPVAVRCAGGTVGALVAVLVFGLHPVQSDVVYWISARADPLAAILVLGGLGAHLRASGGAGRRCFRWLAAGCCFLAPLAKETGALLPALAWWLDRKRAAAAAPAPAHLRRWLGDHLPHAGALLAALAVRTAVLAGAGEPPASANLLADAGAATRTATAVAILGRYAALLLFPVHLSADYSFDSIAVSHAGDPWLYAGAGVLAAVVVAARRPGMAGFCSGAFLLSWLPVSNLIVLAPSAMAERYLYLGLVAVALGCGAGSARLWSSPWRRPLAAALLVVVCLWSARVHLRAGDWRDDGALFESVLQRFPRNARALENLGQWRARNGDLAAAARLVRESLVVKPDNPRALLGLGLLEARRGRLPEAEVALDGALSLRPHLDDALLARAEVRERLGRHREAASDYRRVLARSPDHAVAAAGLARLIGAAAQRREPPP